MLREFHAQELISNNVAVTALVADGKGAGGSSEVE